MSGFEETGGRQRADGARVKGKAKAKAVEGYGQGEGRSQAGCGWRFASGARNGGVWEEEER
jgi:hypothetical protein